MRFLPDRALLDYSLNRYKKQNLFWFFRTWVTWATANVTTNNWFHHHGSVTALQSPYPRCPPNPLKGECQCRQVGTRLGTSAARQCLAHRLLRALRWPFGLPFGREHFVVYTDLHRFRKIIICDNVTHRIHRITQNYSVSSVHSVFIYSTKIILMVFDEFWCLWRRRFFPSKPSKSIKNHQIIIFDGPWWDLAAEPGRKLHKIAQIVEMQKQPGSHFYRWREKF